MTTLFCVGGRSHDQPHMAEWRLWAGLWHTQDIDSCLRLRGPGRSLRATMESVGMKEPLLERGHPRSQSSLCFWEMLVTEYQL